MPCSAPGIGYYRSRETGRLRRLSEPPVTATDASDGLEIERELISLGFPDGQFHFRESC